MDPDAVFGRIIGSPRFCVACANSSDCYCCEFCKLVGECGTKNSLYLEFEDKYDKERNDEYKIHG